MTALYEHAAPPADIGDVNMDGSVDTLDALLVLRYVMQVGELEHPELADMDALPLWTRLQFSAPRFYKHGRQRMFFFGSCAE